MMCLFMPMVSANSHHDLFTNPLNKEPDTLASFKQETHYIAIKTLIMAVLLVYSEPNREGIMLPPCVILDSMLVESFPQITRQASYIF